MNPIFERLYKLINIYENSNLTSKTNTKYILIEIEESFYSNLKLLSTVSNIRNITNEILKSLNNTNTFLKYHNTKYNKHDFHVIFYIIITKIALENPIDKLNKYIRRTIEDNNLYEFVFILNIYSFKLVKTINKNYKNHSNHSNILIINFLKLKNKLINEHYYLIHACKYSNINTIKYLIENGADINIVDNEGNTPLINASKYSDINIIKYLIEHGADVNITDNKNNKWYNYLFDNDEIDLDDPKEITCYIFTIQLSNWMKQIDKNDVNFKDNFVKYSAKIFFELSNILENRYER
jgi:hypothetical protein